MEARWEQKVAALGEAAAAAVNDRAWALFTVGLTGREATATALREFLAARRCAGGHT